MKLDVVVTNEAGDNVRAALAWYAQRSESAANRWYEVLHEELTALADHPERHPLARENDRVPVELRERHFGSGRRTTHRILFTVRTDKVVVYAVRHVAQDDWRPAQSTD